jgi:hypothetical protein
MTDRSSWLAAVSCALLLVPLSAATAQAKSPSSPHGTGGAPVIERFENSDVFAPDEFFQDLCGITTTTIAHERGSLTTWPDGSQSLHVVRSFIPEDRRLPIERGAATSYFAPDGAQTRITGTPIHLISRTGGVRALDAGLLLIGDPNVAHGHVDVGIDNPDLAPYYCPAD